MDTTTSTLTKEGKFEIYKGEEIFAGIENTQDLSDVKLAYGKYLEKNSTLSYINPLEKNALIAHSVFDVASYILQKLEGQSCSTMKLHKLLYYTQAWSLVWDESPIFKEKIEAWSNGPVIRDLFYFHKGLYHISFSDMNIGNFSKLSENQIQTIDSVLSFYGDKSAQWLIDLTHMETPWINARKGLEQTAKCNRVIELDDIANYYSSL